MWKDKTNECIAMILNANGAVFEVPVVDQVCMPV